MFNIDQAEAFLNVLLEKHEDHLQDARGFGVKTAALPKGLMTLAEAQKIVASFEKDTEQLNKFIMGMHSAGKPPADMKTEFDALLAKANKALDKFLKDKKAAQEAIEKYEDLLVGEHFQEAFEALRHAVLDFDLTDTADIDFTTKLELNADPAYANGQVILSLGSTKVMTVTIGYRASDDLYWTNLFLHKNSKNYKHVVEKTGHTFLPRFIRESSEQVKALADKEIPGLFRSKKKVELTVVDPAQLMEALYPAFTTKLKEIWGGGNIILPWRTRLELDSKGTEGKTTLNFSGHGWNDQVSQGMAESRLQSMETQRKKLMTPFEVKTTDGRVWVANPKVEDWSYSVTSGTRTYKFTPATLSSVWPLEWQTNIQAIPMTDLRKRALNYALDPAPFGAKKTELVQAIRAAATKSGFPMPSNFRVLDGPISYTLTLKKTPGKAASDEHFAKLYLTAGGSDFYNYIPIPDVARAFREAVDNARHERGHDSYSGTIKEKDGYKVRSQEPMTRAKANDFADRDMENNQKWGPAFAVPVAEEKVLKKETVTVTVDAKDENDARRRGAMKIKATGRIPPNATILVTITKVGGAGMTPGGKIKTFDVTGERKAAIVGVTTGWLFYGIASS